MSREPASAKGRRILTEGRVILLEVRPGRVTAAIRGEGAIHKAGFDGAWWCTCPARSDQCSHLHALRLVTAPDLTDRP